MALVGRHVSVTTDSLGRGPRRYPMCYGANVNRLSGQMVLEGLLGRRPQGPLRHPCRHHSQWV